MIKRQSVLKRQAPVIGLAAISLTLSGPASAQENCVVIGSILSGTDQDLSGLGIEINGSGRVDVTKLGAVGVVRGADTCSLSAPSDGFEIDCDWRFSASEADTAQKQFDALRSDLEACLPVSLEEQKPRRYTAEEIDEFRTKYGSSFVENVTQTEGKQRYKADVETQANDDVTISVSLDQSARTGRFWLNVNIDRY